MSSHLTIAGGGDRRRISFQSNQVLVLDDFLNERTFRHVLDHCGRAPYRSVHSQNWRKVWRINDGTPLQAGTTYWSKDPSTFPKDANKALYPAGSDIDLFIDQLVSVLPCGEQLIGTDWTDFTATPYIYPTGSCLSLHRDGFSYSGAYTFFAHREWNVHWGGHLLVLDPRTPAPTYSNELLGPQVSWIDDASENSLVLDPGFAQCIFPKPNRLVLIAPDAQHLLSRVDVNAGQHPRISIAGFFRKQST